VLDQLLALVVMVNDDMTQSLARRGLTVSRAGVLWQLRHRGPSTGRTLADALGVSARTVTGLVDGLVASGHVTRQPHPSDRRAALVTCTEHGTRVTRSLEREQREFTHLLFDGLSDAEFDGLADGLGHLVKQIREHLPPAPRSATARREPR
jgi:DNA-binding MarR family transcriptional regulator